MTENEISYKIRGCIFNVFNELGPGMLEAGYAAGLEIEFKRAGLRFNSEVKLPMYYKGEKTDVGYRMDFVVEDKVVVEVKSLENVLDVHHKQLITYLKLSAKKLGLLVNFNCSRIDKNIFRKVNGL